MIVYERLYPHEMLPGDILLIETEKAGKHVSGKNPQRVVGKIWWVNSVGNGFADIKVEDMRTGKSKVESLPENTTYGVLRSTC